MSSYQFTILDRYNLFMGMVIIFIASAAILLNNTITHYPYVNYFPLHAFGIFLILLLLTAGTYLLFNKNSNITHALYYLCQFYLVLSLIAYFTVAVQLTPFRVIDAQLLHLDTLLGYDTASVLNTLIQYPKLYFMLSYAYALIVPELAFLPCILMILLQFNCLKRFYFMLLSTSLFGFSFYYFWPTTAPASVVTSSHFLASQHATLLKFNEIHHYLKITTQDGGLVAMPSFHIIWAWICQQSVRSFPLIWWGLLPINLILILSCVLMGWHYLVDLMGSMLVLTVCYLCMKMLEKKL